MNILLIGGTRFLGRELAEIATTKGHDVTIFHRGKHPIKSSGRVTEILGNRNSDLSDLAGKEWDAVIDTVGYLPVGVRASVEALKESVGIYVFISSLSAYSDFSEPNYNESAPLARLTAEEIETVEAIDPYAEMTAPTLGVLYGGAKVLCEEIVKTSFPDHHIIVRPGLIIGEYDHTDRFTYWVMRVAKGGEVLAPGNPKFNQQFIDAKDLAGWTIRAIESEQRGEFNLDGAPGKFTFESMLKEIKEATDSNAEFTWVTDSFLEENDVAPWSDMPFYMPVSEELAGFALCDVQKALSAGLSFRPFHDTVTDLHKWRAALGREMRAGITGERESLLLKKWHEQKRA